MEEIYSLVHKRRRIMVSFDSTSAKRYLPLPFDYPDGKQNAQKANERKYENILRFE